MKILITGGAGFIGSHLTDFLLAENNQVVAIDNLSLGRLENLEKAQENPNFKFKQFDILEKEKLFELFKNEKFDTVFHFAANSDIAKSHANPNIDFDNTFLTTYNILLAMKEFKVKEIVFASTSAIYGETTELISENFGPLLPVSHYGASKLASEGFIASFCENYNIKTWIIRFPNVIGERATHGVIFDFIKKLKTNPNELEVLGNGEQNKPYLYVNDLIEAIFFAYKNTNEKLNFFNIGVESRTKVKEIAKMVIEEMNLEAKIKYTGGDRGWIGDVPEFRYCLDKIHKLGWQAQNTSNEAVKKAIKYILEKDLCN